MIRGPHGNLFELLETFIKHSIDKSEKLDWGDWDPDGDSIWENLYDDAWAELGTSFKDEEEFEEYFEGVVCDIVDSFLIAQDEEEDDYDYAFA